MKVYAVCPMSCDVACGHTKPDKVFGKFEDAEKYVVVFYEYALTEHYTYEDDNYSEAWYYTPNGNPLEESNVVIIAYNVF